ncbi:MAG TPA: cytochrome b5 domain-containing protein [Patescibacteria group bacterium]|jgi:cytochrome b involved in lipid metabolism|nr:cytochrome b5 domain-containing protein [Patescibacteria group bacterium]
MKFKTLLIALPIVLLAAGCSKTTTPNSNPTSPASSQASTQTYSMADVQSANTSQKCWTVIRGGVYDLTSYLNLHPGGKANIMKVCGIDGTALFDAQHQGQGRPEAQLAKLKIGTLK